ncbi:MAG TPA: septum formation initiator family protein [Desulfobacterales bacterium]|nr:septum formation initiator family protein [Desulfobacterales bacterium]
MKTTLRKYKLIVITSIVTLIVLSIWIYFSPYGLRNYLDMRARLTKVSTEVNNLKQQNKALRLEIRHLQSDPAYQEEIARRNFHMLKRNEMIFDFSKPKKKGR